MKQLALVLIFLICAFRSIAAEPIIFVVRHAEKAADGNTKDPDLSEGGRARAEALAKTLKDANITAIYVTEFKRTQETAEPLLRALNMRDETIVSGSETEALIAQLREVKGNALVVGHSNTLPEIVKGLGLPDSITINDNDYDDLFIICIGTPTKLLHLHYH